MGQRLPYLDVFGAHAGALVRDVLAERGVRFLGSRNTERFDRDGHRHLRFEVCGRYLTPYLTGHSPLAGAAAQIADVC